MGLSIPAIPPIERFNKRFIPVTESGCWLWEGHIGETGYGLIRMTTNPKDTPLGAHRASWILFRGEIPAGMLVCHSCDVRSCVNPSHLFLGSYADNMQDASRKGRMDWKEPIRSTLPRGERHHSAKLTDNDVRNILIETGTYLSIAKKYGISNTVVGKIKSRQLWKHIQ